MKAADMLTATAVLVGGQRAQDYGDKTQNHERIADLWNMWLKERQGIWEKSLNSFIQPMDGEGLPPFVSSYDVAMMMLLVKVARLMNSPGHQDSHIDIAGYASILEEIANG